MAKKNAIKSENPNWMDRECSKLTEAEIKKDFDWAWQWAKPVEEE